MVDETKVKVPYVSGYGSITKALERIKTASTPDRFTQDFLSTKLGMPGGSPKPVIPFLKRIGFLKSDGSPTDLYKQFRNPDKAGAAAAQALRKGYAPFYEINEYAHDLNDAGLKGVVVQATGLDENASTVKAIVGSFKALKTFADFGQAAAGDVEDDNEVGGGGEEIGGRGDGVTHARINLGYTINLHLPATSDISVFNAIFKSLREHLLK